MYLSDDENELIKIKCRYYDGFKPMPIEGFLIFEYSRVRIELDNDYNGPVSVPLGSLQQFTINNNEVTLGLSEGKPNQINPVFKFECFSELEILKKRISIHSRKIKGQSLLVLKPLHKIVSLLLLIIIFAFIFQSSLEHIHKIISPKIDIKIGNKIEKSLRKEYKILPAESLTMFLNNMVNKLKNKKLKDQVFKVSIIDDSGINAFALPNGSIYFYRGLLEKSESPEEVIGVLAHEISHVENRHAMRQLIKSLGTMSLISIMVGGGLEGAEFAEGLLEISGIILALKYSREFETEADKFAIEKLKRENISIIPFAKFFNKLNSNSFSGNLLESIEWLSTHPLNQTRVQFIENEAKNQIGINNLDESVSDWKNFLFKNGIKTKH